MYTVPPIPDTILKFGASMAPLKTLDRPGLLGDRVYITLREHVCSGWVPSGRPLQEAALAAQLGVSRTPVREALARLASEGLLGSDGRSFIVPSLSEVDVEDIYELRLLLEPEALRQVALRARDKAQMAPFREQLALMVAAHAENDAAAFTDANYRFRAAWLELIPNPRLLRAIELYGDHVRYLRALTLGDREVRTVVLNGLKRIAAALAAADGASASGAMRQHLLEAKRILRGALNSNSK
jgi:DNA-binding GntR family transcriptional regulator